MGRPRKYRSEADARAAKSAKQRQRRAARSAARNALKKDPTKPKDAKVNAEAYPFAPINDETMAVIHSILDEAGQLASGACGMMASVATTRKCAAKLAAWEEEHKLRLPYLDQTGERILWSYIADGSNGPVNFSYRMTFGERWNRFCDEMRFWLQWDQRRDKNKRAAKRRAEREQAKAVAAGLTVAAFRDHHDANAKRQWQDRTQAAYHRAKSEEALAKRNVRIAREDSERMKQHETFGRF